MKKLFARFAKDESGVTAIEYGLIATALIGVAIIAGATTLGGTLNTTFNGMQADHAGRSLIGHHS